MKNTKKILIFSHTYPPALDGGSQILFQMAMSLARNGAKVRVITSDALSTDDFISPSGQRLKTGRQIKDDFVVFRMLTIRRLRKMLRFWEKIIPFKRLKDWMALLQTGPVFLWLPILWLKKWNPDVVIAGVFPTTIPIYGRLVSWWTGAKLILLPSFHIDDRGFYKKPLVNCLKKADLLLALTNYEKKFYQKRFDISSEKIIVWLPPVAAELLMKPADKAQFLDPPTILFLGNQAAHKRIELLIDAFKVVVRRIPRARLIIAGRRTLYSPKIDKKLKGLPSKIRQKIRVIDGYDRQKGIELLDKAWVLVNPSVHESLGLVFLEAWARKKPVIGVDMPVTRELIKDGSDGCLFEKNDVRDLAKKTARLLKDKKKIKYAGELGYKNLTKLIKKCTKIKL